MATNLSFNYEKQEIKYALHRRTDARIAAQVNEALGKAQTVLNVGAGAGSYEPADRYITAVEPSAQMRAQRQKLGKVPAINGTADHLPFDDQAFDASMAMVTIHHWPDLERGLKELRRVTKDQVILMTFDPAALHLFWNIHYFPELIAIEQKRYPEMSRIAAALGGQVTIREIPVPLDCTDGFQEAFYGRPEAFLENGVRRAQSAWGFLPEGLEETLVQNLAKELASGAWDQKYGHYRTQPEFIGALRLVIARP